MSVRCVVLVASASPAPSVEAMLVSLAACERPEGLGAVVLVENGARPSAAPRLRSLAAEPPGGLPLVHLMGERANKSDALNVGLRWIAEREPEALVYMTDDDTVLAPDVLRRFVEAARAAPRERFFGGPIRPRYERPPEPWELELLPLSARGLDLGEEPRDESSARFLGPNWAAWAQDLRAVGGFRTDRGPGTDTTGQESAMMNDLLRLGRRGRWVPGAWVEHVVPASHLTPRWLVERSRRQARENALVTAQAGRLAVRRSLQRAARVPGALVRQLTGVLRADVAATTRARVDVARELAFLGRLAALTAQRARWRR